MNKILVLLLALTACSPGAQKQEEASSAANESSPATTVAGPDSGSLTGLYEGGSAGQPNQLCIVENKRGVAHFGLVVWGTNMHSCSGTGTASRQGGNLMLAMAGDSECKITASLAGGTVTLPATAPAGCSYYCGARARLGGAAFSRKGATRADALKAKDLVGESLCAGL